MYVICFLISHKKINNENTKTKNNNINKRHSKATNFPIYKSEMENKL